MTVTDPDVSDPVVNLLARARAGARAANLAVLRHIALNLLKQERTDMTVPVSTLNRQMAASMTSDPLACSFTAMDNYLRSWQHNARLRYVQPNTSFNSVSLE